MNIPGYPNRGIFTVAVFGRLNPGLPLWGRWIYYMNVFVHMYNKQHSQVRIDVIHGVRILSRPNLLARFWLKLIAVRCHLITLDPVIGSISH